MLSQTGPDFRVVYSLIFDARFWQNDSVKGWKSLDNKGFTRKCPRTLKEIHSNEYFDFLNQRRIDSAHRKPTWSP